MSTSSEHLTGKVHSNSGSRRRAGAWKKLSAVFAVVAVAGFFGAVALAPDALQPAVAEPNDPQFEKRIHQKFTPNPTAEEDLVTTDTDFTVLPDEEEQKRKAAEEALKRSGGAGAQLAPLRYTGGGSPAEWMAAAGIPESDWGYVDYIVSRESGWNPNATNAGSGACGLVQALPCSKVPGNGYNPVDNLRWASGYANGRYGSWQAAYAFWTANHWW